MTLTELQQRFTRHLRDPRSVAVPAGIEPRRMKIYEELVFANLDGFIRRGFPVLCSLLDAAAWQELVRGFISRYRCHTPLFLEIGEEFMAFVRDDAAARALLPPFAEELAHYEWVELALDVDEHEIALAGIDPDADLATGVLVPNPLAVTLVYAHPVHRIDADNRPAQAPPQPTCLVAYRDRADAVGCVEVSAVGLRLLELLQERPCDRDELAARLALELGGDTPALREVVRDVVHALRERDVILGVRTA